MNPVIARLHSLGHHHNPQIKHLFTGKDAEWWDRLKLTDYEGQALVHSYQLFLREEYEEIALKQNHQAAMHDGEVGPVFQELLNVPRCGVPDFTDTNSAEMRAIGSGGWKHGCLGNNDRHEVAFSVDDRRSMVKSWWAEIEEIVVAAYAEIGIAMIRIDDPNDAQINVMWEPLGGSTIGLAMLPGRGHCHKRHFCKLHPDFKPSLIMVAKLWAHEIGHNMNSGHIQNDVIMHPSMRPGPWNGSFRGTAFGNRLSEYYGGEPVDPPPPDDPPPPPGVRGLEIRPDGGALSIYNGGREPITIPPGTSYPERFEISTSATDWQIF